MNMDTSRLDKKNVSQMALMAKVVEKNNVKIDDKHIQTVICAQELRNLHLFILYKRRMHNFGETCIVGLCTLFSMLSVICDINK